MIRPEIVCLELRCPHPGCGITKGTVDELQRHIDQFTPGLAEVRLLRAETEQLRSSNSELKLKTQVELESLYEQLRVRKIFVDHAALLARTPSRARVGLVSRPKRSL